MSISKFNSINNSMQHLIDWLDEKGIYGPIAYLETAMEELDAAKDEYKEYIDSGIAE